MRESDTDVVVRSEAQLGPLDCTITTTVEYDGLCRFDLTLDNPGSAAFQRLRLIIPLDRERGIYYHLPTGGAGDAGLVPESGIQTVFRPFLWLGDDERGLTWCAESDRGWHTDGKPLEVRHGEDTVEMVIHFVDGTVSAKRTELTFALQATPVKQVPEDWRAWRVDQASPYIFPGRVPYAPRWEEIGVPLQWRYLWWTAGSQERIFSAGHTTPLQITDDLGRHAATIHDRGTRVLPYMFLSGVNKITTDFERYYPVWQIPRPREMPYYGRVIMEACPASNLSDFLLYGLQKWVKQQHIDGVYFDGARPAKMCSNQLHGHGWVDETGAVHEEYPIFGLRDFYRRLWAMLTENVDNPAVWVHHNGNMCTPCFSFVTAGWQGEDYQGALRGGDTYLSDLVPLDFWRARMQATQWGIVPIWLSSNFGTDEQRMAQYMDTLALLLVHGTPFTPRGRVGMDEIRKIWTAQAQFDIGHARFHGYWQNGASISLQPKDERILASFFERDGRVMLIIANLTDTSREVTAQLSGVASPDSGEFTDVLTGEAFPLAGGSLNLDVPGRSFRLLRG